MRFLALFLFLLPTAAPAEALLRALSAGGDRVIMTYGVEWVEVETETGRTRGIVPPPTCVWNGAAYRPGGTGFAISARCVFDPGCETDRAGLWRTEPSGRLVYVAHRFGRVWSDPLWSADGSLLIVRDAALAPKRLQGLAETPDPYACEEAAPGLAIIDLERGGLTALDIAPRSWTLLSPIGLSGPRIAAAARDREAAFFAEWDGADWAQIADGAGRLLYSADFARSVTETCDAAGCALAVRDKAGARRVAFWPAPAEALALSPSGDALAAQEGGRLRLFDLEGGRERDLGALLALSPPWGPDL